jgi:hypothetical protein
MLVDDLLFEEIDLLIARLEMKAEQLAIHLDGLNEHFDKGEVRQVEMMLNEIQLRIERLHILPTLCAGWAVTWWAFIGLLRLRVALGAENLALRQQINVLRRTAPKRLRFGSIDRLIFVGLFRGLSTARDALAIVQPATVIRWHRAGFRAYWRWKIASSRGKPTVPLEVRRLIRAMSLANPLLGAHRGCMANSSSSAST